MWDEDDGPDIGFCTRCGAQLDGATARPRWCVGSAPLKTRTSVPPHTGPGSAGVQAEPGPFPIGRRHLALRKSTQNGRPRSGCSGLGESDPVQMHRSQVEHLTAIGAEPRQGLVFDVSEGDPRTDPIGHIRAELEVV